MSLRTAGKKGLLPDDPARPRVRLSRALIPGTLAPVQANWGHIPLVGMLGNDQWGDCPFAGIGHIVEAVSFWGQGQEIELTTTEVLAAYSAATGFNPAAGQPGSNPTDNGSSLQTALGYLQQTGLAGQKIALFGELDIADTNGWQLALSLFGPLMLGTGVGDAEQQDFNAGIVWDAAPGASPNPEDHAVVLCGYQPGIYWAWTWGGIQGITPGWFARNAYEVWAPLTAEWVNAHTGRDPEGVNLAVLGQEFTTVTGQPDPFAAAKTAAIRESMDVSAPAGRRLARM